MIVPGRQNLRGEEGKEEVFTPDKTQDARAEPSVAS